MLIVAIAGQVLMLFLAFGAGMADSRHDARACNILTALAVVMVPVNVVLGILV